MRARQGTGRRLLPTDRSRDTHVSNLRRKLMKYTDRVTLQSVRLGLHAGGRARERTGVAGSLYWRIFLADLFDADVLPGEHSA